MAGVYTHFAAVQKAMKQVLDEELLHEEMRQALQEPFTRFVLIGSIAPDYPYLHIISRDSAAWAATMHRWKPIQCVHEGIQELTNIVEPEQRKKCMAWLLGFASHCVADGVIHPVVDLKVGPYKDNKRAHRRCEMSQDVLVHGTLNLGPIAFNRQLSKEVYKASAPNSQGKELDHDLAAAWVRILERVYIYPEHPSVTLPDVLCWFYRKLVQLFLGRPGPERRIPDPHAWHRHMGQIMKKAEISNKVLPFGRDVVALLALGYPQQPLPTYVQGLEIPLYCPCRRRKMLDFEEIFDKAVAEIVQFWQTMSLACQGDTSPLAAVPVWDLNTGTDDKGNFVFWQKQ
jgi:hypothetical protein